MDAPVKSGDILAEKYRVERVLGVGGMGVVVAAHHLELDQRVAIKFLSNFDVDELRIFDTVFTDAAQCTTVIGGTWTGSSCTLP
jgi:hypothetical protein